MLGEPELVGLPKWQARGKELSEEVKKLVKECQLCCHPESEQVPKSRTCTRRLVLVQDQKECDSKDWAGLEVGFQEVRQTADTGTSWLVLLPNYYKRSLNRQKLERPCFPEVAGWVAGWVAGQTFDRPQLWL